MYNWYILLPFVPMLLWMVFTNLEDARVEKKQREREVFRAIEENLELDPWPFEDEHR